MAALAGLRARSGAEGQLAVGRGAGAVVAERPFGIGRLLVDMPDRLVGIHDRQMHGVTGTAALRLQDVGVVLGNVAQRMIHRRRLGIGERAVELVRRADQEASREGLAEAAQAGD